MTAPGEASFTVKEGALPANCPAAAIQWQVSSNKGSSWSNATGSNITGATSATLELNPTATSESGDEFQALLTNAHGKTERRAATLAVNAPPSSLSIDGDASAQDYSTATASLSTTGPEDLIVAFVASDGPYSGGQTSKVSGGGLEWNLAGRETAALGDSEVWIAKASGMLCKAQITATVGKFGYDETIELVALKNSSGLGRLWEHRATLLCFIPPVRAAIHVVGPRKRRCSSLDRLPSQQEVTRARIADSIAKSCCSPSPTSGQRLRIAAPPQLRNPASRSARWTGSAQLVARLLKDDRLVGRRARFREDLESQDEMVLVLLQ